jgi:hypothetical protein
MKRITAALVVTAALLVAAGPASAGDRDCDDFRSQRAAQKFFKHHHPRQDPHNLDADNDGRACEDSF